METKDGPHPSRWVRVARLGADETELWRFAVRAGFILTITVGCAVSVETGWQSPIRTVLALAYLLLGPGLALAELLEIRDPAQRLMIASAASLGLETLLAIGLVYLGAFSTRLGIAILAALTVAALGGAALRLIRSRRDSFQPHRRAW
jgi:hypothetical protein